MITKVISGGQRGTDIAALRAAKAAGVETGGYIPRGFRTLDGPKPEYAEMYGLEEVESPDYPTRTRLNVRESDGTMRIAFNWQSWGEMRTLKEIVLASKPNYDVDPHFTVIVGLQSQIASVRDWIEENEISVLNVAGNAHKDLEPFVEAFVSDFLTGG